MRFSQYFFTCTKTLFSGKRRISKLSLCVLLLFFILTVQRINKIPWVLIEYYELFEKSSTSACLLPKVDPYDPSIKAYIWTSEKMSCKRIQPDLVTISDNGMLSINLTLADLNGYKNLQCSYRCFYHNDGVDDDSLKYDEWINFAESVLFSCEFVEVICKKSGIKVYSYVFTNVIRENKPMENSVTHHVPKADRLSVLILGIDSMSRSNMIRQMPKSVHYLESTLRGVTLEGYTKVGDNTWVNYLAMVTGLRAYPTNEFPADLSTFEEQFFDDYAEFIWKNFSRSGYGTMYIQDRPDIQDFNYGVRKGFLHKPVDHYDRPMWLAMWWTLLHLRSSPFCYNSIPEHKFMLDYVRKFVKAYRDDPSLGILWWTNLSHDYLNKISSADEDFMDFLQTIRPYLNRTILFVLSDHGHRYDAIRNTVIGRLEARMPYATVIVPDWFRNQYSDSFRNLEINSRGRLTTPFDIYATLSDILHNNFANFKENNHTTLKNRVPTYALSLFEPIPAQRNCLQARVPEEYCPCYEEVEIKTTNERRVSAAADFLLAHINLLLANHRPPCSLLHLEAIRSAFVFLPNRGTIKDAQVGYRIPKNGFYISYRFVIEIMPGGALFEGVVKYFVDSENYSVDGDVDRNNAYGNTSACVDDNRLKKYCFCAS